MTWRVAVLALAILVSGGLAPMIRTAVGPERGYAAVGLFVAVLLALGSLGAWWGTRGAPTRLGGASRSVRYGSSMSPGTVPNAPVAMLPSA